MEFWLPLAFLVVATVGSLAYAATRGWRLWRMFKRTSRRTGAALERVAANAERAELRATSSTGNAARLASAAARLQGSLSELALLRAAYAEGRGMLTSLRGAVPRK